MPVEIKELIIKTSVTDRELEKKKAVDENLNPELKEEAKSKSEEKEKKGAKASMAKFKETILAECSAMIIDHLNNINER